MVDWQAEDYTSTGYYWAELKSITLECADQGLNSTDGYVYTGLDHANIPVSNCPKTLPPLPMCRSFVVEWKRRAECEFGCRGSLSE